MEEPTVVARVYVSSSTSDVLYAFKSRGFGGELELVILEKYAPILTRNYLV